MASHSESVKLHMYLKFLLMFDLPEGVYRRSSVRSLWFLVNQIIFTTTHLPSPSYISYPAYVWDPTYIRTFLNCIFHTFCVCVYTISMSSTYKHIIVFYFNSFQTYLFVQTCNCCIRDFQRHCIIRSLCCRPGLCSRPGLHYRICGNFPPRSKSITASMNKLYSLAELYRNQIGT